MMFNVWKENQIILLHSSLEKKKRKRNEQNNLYCGSSTFTLFINSNLILLS